MQIPIKTLETSPAEQLRRFDAGADFATHLQSRGLLSEAALQRARCAARDSGERLETVLPKLGLISDRDFATALSQFLSLPLICEKDFPSRPLLEQKLGASFLRERQLIPVREADGVLVVAMVNALDAYALDAVRFAVGQPVRPCVALPADIESAFNRLYAETAPILRRGMEGTAGASSTSESDLQRLKDSASEAPVIRLVNGLIGRAVQMGASDIHLEPVENELRVRFRIDGVLRNVDALPDRLASAVLSRVKVLAKLNLAERRLPQDGRIATPVRGKEIDIRVAVSPVLNGERATLRILDRTHLVLDLVSLGFAGAVYDRIQDVLKRPHGIVLITGPTGSGKTTTLYAGLNQLNKPDVNILTIEDPIEYQLPGVSQSQVKPHIGLTFATALRSFLRQDPDIMMVGEIRDLETAQIAVQAALTGHLILSTVHTNDAASTVTRLIDMGVDDYLVTATLNGIIAQRLIRRVCAECRETYVPAPGLAKTLEQQCGSTVKTLFRAMGCEKCNGTGYRGRTAIAEVLSISDAVRQAILEKTDAARLRELALRSGMQSLRANGLLRAIAGETTVEEVYRLTGDFG